MNIVRNSSLVLFVVMLALLGGCVNSKEFSIYNANNKYAVGNSDTIKYPSDLKLRKSFSTYYYVKKSSDIPKPLPSLLPPGSKALKEFNGEISGLNLKHYDLLPRYPMPKSVKNSVDNRKHFERLPKYPMPK